MTATGEGPMNSGLQLPGSAATTSAATSDGVVGDLLTVHPGSTVPPRGRGSFRAAVRPLRRVELVGPYALIGVAVITAALVAWGPDQIAGSLAETGAAETTDRVLVAAWWLLAVVLGLWLAAPGRRAPSRRRSRGDAVAQIVIGSAGAVLAVASLAWRVDPTGAWHGLPVVGALVGIVFAGLTCVLLVARRRRVWVAISGGLGAVVLPLTFLLWFQLPGTLHEPFHFTYTADEIAAVAARHVPLSEYIPQYSVLLGYPVAALDLVWPGHLESLVVGWLLLLQVLAVGAAVTMAVLLGGARMAAPGAVVVVAPIFATLWPGTGTGWSASSYFSVLPMRIVLPALTLLAALVVLSHAVTSRRWWHWVLLGVCTGLTVLNNPDYGVPALAAVVVTLALVAGGPRAALAPVMWLGATGVAVFAAYHVLGVVTGNPIRWSSWLTFQLLFGDQGFGTVPVATFGLHIAVVALFIAASVIGFVLVRTSPSASWRGRQGTALCLVGGWSLLTVPYFAGRSLPTTVVVGYAFSVGLVVACTLPMLRVGLRGLRGRRRDGQVPRTIAVSFMLLAVAACGGAAALAEPRRTVVNFVQTADRDHVHDLTAEIASVQSAARANPGLSSALATGAVVQALPRSSLLAVETGLGSVAVTNNNDTYLPVSRTFSTAQCAAPWPDGSSLLLVTSTAAAALGGDPACADYVDFTTAQAFADGAGTTYVLLPRGRG